MKKFYLIVALFSIGLVQVSAQSCTPNAPTGTANVTPATTSLACAERGQAYSATLFIENFNTFSQSGVSGQVDSLRVDSVKNIPCGLNIVMNPANGTLHGGQTGCINIYGTTYEPVGQYKTVIYVHLWATAVVPFFGTQHIDQQGTAESVISSIEAITGPLGVNLGYFIRVKDVCAPTCAAVDTSAGATNLTASSVCTPITDLLKAVVSGPTSTCTGDSVTLHASYCGSPTGAVTFLWSNGATDSIIKVAAPDSVSVVLTGAAGYKDPVTYTIQGLSLPIASDSLLSADSISVAVLNNSTGNSSKIYIVDSVSGSVIDTFAGSGQFFHEFTANGTYYIYTVSNNGCGSDTTQNRIVHITGVPNTGLSEINNINAYVSLYPNPSNGEVNLKIFFAVTSTEIYTVKIYSTQGQEVYSQPFTGNINKAIDLGYLGAGVYLVHINSANLSTVQKLMIK